MRLNTPKRSVFYISIALAVVGLIATLITIPFLSGFAFWLVLVAYILLALGNVLKGF
jgi:hypothetical protein